MLRTSISTTAADVQALIDALINGAPVALNTLNELATALGDSDNEVAAIITQLALKLNASSYTAADVLAKIKTVDGAGSGLDADRLGGLQAADFLQTGDAYTLPDRLGEKASRLPNNDWDDAIINGWYSHGDAANAPAAGWFTIRVTAHQADWVVQEGYSTFSSVDADTNAWRRVKRGTAPWDAWTRIRSTETEILKLSNDNGMIAGGRGSVSNTAPQSDWNHADNTKSGWVKWLLRGYGANGPGSASYYHIHAIEYNSRDGSGNLCQMAYPYLNVVGANATVRNSIQYRHRYSGTWGPWRRILHDGDLKPSLGESQTWQDVSGSRVGNTAYQNTTGRAIIVSVSQHSSQTRYFQVSQDNVSWLTVATMAGFGNVGDTKTATVVIPDGHYYRTDTTSTIGTWVELRA